MYEFFEKTKSKILGDEEVVPMQLDNRPKYDGTAHKTANEQRLEDYKQIHQEEQEMNKILKTMTTLVHEQSPLVDTIRDNIDNTLDNVDDGSINVRIAEASRTCCIS